MPGYQVALRIDPQLPHNAHRRVSQVVMHEVDGADADQEEEDRFHQLNSPISSKPLSCLAFTSPVTPSISSTGIPSPGLVHPFRERKHSLPVDGACE